MKAFKSSHSKWWVIFTSTDQQHWIYRFIDRSFGHVYLVQDINDYQWLVVQPRISATSAKIMLKSQYPHIRDLTAPEDKVVEVEVYEQPRYRGTINWFSCVEQVKAFLGIKSFWTLTPKQLYKGLIGGRYE